AEAIRVEAEAAAVVEDPAAKEVAFRQEEGGPADGLAADGAAEFLDEAEAALASDLRHGWGLRKRSGGWDRTNICASRARRPTVRRARKRSAGGGTASVRLLPLSYTLAADSCDWPVSTGASAQLPANRRRLPAGRPQALHRTAGGGFPAAEGGTGRGIP